MKHQRENDVNTALLGAYQCAIDPEKFPDFVASLESWLVSSASLEGLIKVEETSRQVWDALGETQLRLANKSPVLGNAPRFVLSSFERPAEAEDLEAWERFQTNIFAPDLIRLRQWMGQCPDGSELLFRTAGNDGASCVCIARKSGSEFIVQDTEVSLTACVENLIKTSFDITHSEMLVLRQLVMGHSLKEISDDLGKSHETIRSQVKSLGRKLSVNRQQDIQRLVGNIQLHSKTSHGEYDEASEGTLHRVVRPGGRNLFYRSFGPPDGFPVFVCSDFSGGSRLPQGTSRAFGSIGLRAIALTRAGYGESDPVDVDGEDLIDSHCADYIAVANDQNIGSFALLGIGTGMAIAYSLGKRFPKRVISVTGLNVYPPILLRRDAMQFKSGMYRLGALASLLAPSTLRLLTKFVIAQAARIQNTQQFLALSNSTPKKEGSERSYFRHYLKPNIDDILLAKGIGAASDCTYLSVDWARGTEKSQPIPPTHILQHHDFPFVSQTFTREFADRIGATFTVVSHDFRESHLNVEPLAAFIGGTLDLK